MTKNQACYFPLIACVTIFGLFTVLPQTIFAGQSLVLGSSGVLVTSGTNQYLPRSQSWRMEFQLHNVAGATGTPGQKLFFLNSIGTFGTVFADGSVNVADLWDVGEGGAPCQVSTQGFANVLVRVQRNTAAQTFTCELWNFDATGYTSQIRTFGVAANFASGTDVDAVSQGSAGSLGFLRISTNLLPLGSKPPTTADAGGWTEWKFDGNLADSSSNARALTGSAVFASTPNQTAFALAKTYGTPAWTNWISLRAGYPAHLDGTSSYSLADGSSQVSCFWQLKDGPGNVQFDNRS